MVAAPADRSPSVVGLATRFGDDPVTAGQLVNDLVANHPQYAGKRAADVLPLWPEPARRRTAESWLTGCERLLADGAGGLNGQLVILLLALLDPPSGRAMTESGLVQALLAGYVAVDASPDLPLGSVLDPVATAPGTRASPLLAAMFGLADPPARLPVTSPTGAEVAGLCWPWTGGPVVAYSDGRVEQVETALGAASGVTGPVSAGADEHRAVVHQRHGAGEASVPWGGVLPTVEAGSSSPPVLRAVSRSGLIGVRFDGSARAVRVGPLDGGDAADTDPSGTHLSLPEGVAEPVGLAVTDDGASVVAVDDRGRLIGWGPDPTVPPWVWDHPWASEPVRPGGGLDLAADGRVIAVGTADGGVLLVHRADPGPPVLMAELTPTAGSTSPADMVALSPDSSFLLVRRAPQVDRYDLRLGADRLRSGYLNDLASRGRDYAGLDNDVEALAMLVASRQLEPPLSIGLFGDWGTGKSFFLNRLRRRVDELSVEARDSGLPQHQVDYWKHVRCLEFNAWTFAEANLWASLMESVLGVMDARPVAAVGPSPIAEPLVRSGLLGGRRATAEDELRSRGARLANAQRAALRSRLLVAGLVGLAVAALVLVAVGLVTDRLGVWVGGLGAAGVVLAGYVAAFVSITGKVTAAAADAAQGGRSVSRPFSRWWRDESELRSAQAARDEAAEEVQRLDVIEASPARMVTEYVAGRRGSGDYRKHLGLVGLVRADLERIDEAVTAANEAVAPAAGPPTAQELEDEGHLNRVVVFIDDLDRCPPARVVEVLEAVHLLLAYRLFVVVLAVDSRWLQQSLRAHYRDLLAGERAGAATPLDYLEKIVQLPYQLPRMTRAQVTTMISDLAGADEAGGQEVVPEPVTAPAASTAAAVGHRGGEVAAATAPRRRPPTVDLEPEGLHVTPQEARWLAGLAPLVGSTPRTVKRFVNAYRVLKARSTAPRVFATDSGPDPEYRRAAFLLAVLVGCEEYAVRFVPVLRSGRYETVRAVLDAARGNGEARAQRDRVWAWAAANGWLDRSVAPLVRTMEDVGRFSFVDLLG